MLAIGHIILPLCWFIASIANAAPTNIPSQDSSDAVVRFEEALKARELEYQEVSLGISIAKSMKMGGMRMDPDFQALSEGAQQAEVDYMENKFEAIDQQVHENLLQQAFCDSQIQ